jgi:hypothetical protein
MSEVRIPDNATDVVPPIEPAVIAHFEAVQAELTAREHAIVRRVASGLSAGELGVWFVALSKLTVADAVAKIRALIGEDESES